LNAKKRRAAVLIDGSPFWIGKFTSASSLRVIVQADV